MHLRHSHGGIPETDIVEGVPSVTGREIPPAAYKSNAEGWLGLARHCLAKSNLVIAVSLELRKHHASDRTRTSLKKNNLRYRLYD